MATGFECDFVQKPQNAFQSECPICLLVLREPYQATCCGKSFCKECIEQVREKSEACPACKVENYNLFHNLGLQQSLYDFRVYCTHKSKGCKWIGELRELDNHLNSDPPADKSLQGCPFSEVSCPLSYAGCNVRLTRKNMFGHLECEAIHHLLLQARKQSLLLASMKNLHTENEMLRSIIGELRDEKQQLEQRLTDLEARTGVSQTTGNHTDRQPVKVVEFVMKGFEKLKRERTAWYSSPFYTHTRGYKMCLQVNADGLGQGKGTHVSAYLHMMRGEFDDELRWPFRGQVTLQLVDQEEDRDHFRHTFHFTDATPIEVRERQKDRERSSNGRGPSRFIPLDDLRPKFLKNDCLRFRIIRCEIK